MFSSFFQYIDNLPKELIFIVYDYIPAVAMIFLNKEYYVRYSKEYYKEVEKRVYEMRPELMKKYYSHNN